MEFLDTWLPRLQALVFRFLSAMCTCSSTKTDQEVGARLSA